MRFIVYAILMVLFFIVAHLNHSHLLIDAENNAGQMGGYIGGVILFPILCPAIIYGIAMLFSKTKKISFIRCSNWVVGLFLLGNIGTYLSSNTPKKVTLPAAQLTVTVPSRSWKLTEIKNINAPKMLISGNANILISAERHSQNKLGIHQLTDIEKYSRNLLGQEYDEELYQVYECTAKNFQCGYQNITIQLGGKADKELFYVYLIDKTDVIQLNVVINEDNFTQDYKTFKEVLNTAVNATP